MASEREQNGPTQVHPALNYNELTSHMQLNGLNGLNGIGVMNKSYGERGKLLWSHWVLLRWRIYLRILKLTWALKKYLSRREKIFHNALWACASFRWKFSYLVVAAFSSNGSNFTVTRFTLLKFRSRICLAMAAKTPPERVQVPLNLIDMLFTSFS